MIAPVGEIPTGRERRVKIVRIFFNPLPSQKRMKIEEMLKFLRRMKDSGCEQVEFQDDNWNTYSGTLHELSGRAIVVVSADDASDETP